MLSPLKVSQKLNDDRLCTEKTLPDTEMFDSETALGDRVDSTLPTILAASSRGQLPTRMGRGSSAPSRKGGQREPVEVTSDEMALEKGVVTLSRQRLRPRVSYPRVPASKSHQVEMC